MRIKNICILLITLVFTQGCKKTVYNEITDEEMKWLVYDKGEFFVFADSASVDTFYVTSRGAGYTVDKPYYNEGAAVTFLNYSDTFPGDIYGNIGVKKDNDNGCKAAYNFPHFPLTVMLTDITPVPTLNINGVDYTNVYVSEADSIYYSPTNYLRKIYYTKEDGFLMLENIYGGIQYKIN